MERWADEQPSVQDVERLLGGMDQSGRQRRHDAGTTQITARDMWALVWVGQQYTIRADHLQRLLGRDPRGTVQVPGVLGKPTVERVIRRWRQAGWVEARQILAREPVWVWLTRVGLQQMGLPYKPWGAKAAALNHLYWCNAARLWVERRDEEKGRQGVWIGERELRYQVEQAERGVRSQHGQVSRRHVPDAEAIYGTTRIAIEVELTPKVPDRALAILRELVRGYQAVWYFVSPEARGVIGAVLQRLPVEQQRQVSLLDLDQCG